MKKIIILSILQIALLATTEAQVLNVDDSEQQQSEWCWAGCTKTMLDYYGYPQEQCTIAEYARTSSTWHNFGSTNCCTSPSQGCNYWNYNWGYAGSIQDILVHFGNIQNTGVGAALTIPEITTELQNNRLFVIRWGWSSGGGHFIVGHGISGNNIYFMNPWFGEGMHIATYSNVVNGVDGTSSATHTWTHTNKITSNMTAIHEPANESAKLLEIYPNPFKNQTTLSSERGFVNATVSVCNVLGQEVNRVENVSGKTVTIPRNNMSAGIYLVQIKDGNYTYASQRVAVVEE